MLTQHFDPPTSAGKPRILFIGWAHSTHTHAWIDLVRAQGFDVRLFALPLGFPPEDWSVPTYVTQSGARNLNRQTRCDLYPLGKADLHVRNILVKRKYGAGADAPRHYLAQVIGQWQPHVVHTLGLDPAGMFLQQTLDIFGQTLPGKWVQQIRGGSDMFTCLNDEHMCARLLPALRQCDSILIDNNANRRILADLGGFDTKIAPEAPIPGTGGIDVEGLVKRWSGPPSTRTTILMPKAYECEYSKTLPVLEALKLAWPGLDSPDIVMLAMDDETRKWANTLPLEIKQKCRFEDRVPRKEVLDIMGRSRVVLAPSLVDGVPNSLYEAMALGAVPIVSPLESIKTVVKGDENVLFANNLQPEEMADSLIRAMTDDQRSDTISAANRTLVSAIANRQTIGLKLKEFYENIL